jgi:undecaprenyl-phosphate 4-deoxy-4-formamido-L-arabinose transferase
MNTPRVSVVIPVYNEEKVLAALFARLYPVLDAAGFTYEIVFVNDGSRDGSGEMLADQFRARPDVTRVVMFAGNFGQHRAILAGFEVARGESIVTLDADLQNPPEEIPKLVAKMAEGYDYVGTIRRERNDSLWRHVASRLINRVRERTTRIRITDQGCMLRAYSRRVVDLVSKCQERNTFIPALAYSFALKPVEVEVEHAARAAGESKYSFYQLIRLNFDLMTGFTLAPLQLFSMLGMAVSAASGVLVVVLAARRLIIGPEEGGLFTLFGIAFFMIGIALFGIGLVGEYVGRIYQEVQQRPRYVIAGVLEQDARKDAA